MAEHPIQGLMNVTMEKIHQMVDSNTIIGKPITTEDGITILPVSKVSFGFAAVFPRPPLAPVAAERSRAGFEGDFGKTFPGLAGHEFRFRFW